MGGQFGPVVTKIIQAESQPIRHLEAHKTKQEAKLKLFQEFRSRVTGLDKILQDMATFRKFRELKADLGSGDALMSVTIDKDRAETGQYQIEIDKLAERSSSISNGFEDPDEPVLGAGFISLNKSDGGSTEIYVEESDSSLHGIAALINRNPAKSVQAAVIKDASEPDAPWKLLITAHKEGAANQVDYPEFYFLNGSVDLEIADDKDASNAEVLVDGFQFELEANDIPDFLPGVNIHLKQANSSQPFTLTITEDYQKISGKIKGLVDQVNQVLQFIYKQNAIDDTSDTSTTFAGDSTLQTVEYKIRNILHDSYSTIDPDTEQATTVFLSTLGLEFEKNGQLTMKTEKFEKNLEKNFDAIADAFTGPTGLISRLKTLVGNYMGPTTGFLSVKEQGLRSRVKEIDTQIEHKTQYIERRKQDLVGKFARLESTLANMQKQQQYLSANLGGGGGMLAQLTGG